MKTRNILPQDVKFHRPAFREFWPRPARARQIVCQRVNPHVHRVRGIARDLYPPAHLRAAARDTQVLQPSLYRRNDLLLSETRDYRVRVIFVEF